ncbi:hypothetical protein F442_00628 [Phytophthora nicotianae P10297]|uniref:Uncharacterized protein n=1 Tax=Phytophthora nicotianae P10297 TaxID=1317064 RepID=W3A889_PHYNI|nr:hypothetical protein F442_00628 [Phytophthora nicotianae P10297]
MSEPCGETHLALFILLFNRSTSTLSQQDIPSMNRQQLLEKDQQENKGGLGCPSHGVWQEFDVIVPRWSMTKKQHRASTALKKFATHSQNKISDLTFVGALERPTASALGIPLHLENEHARH